MLQLQPQTQQIIKPRVASQFDEIARQIEASKCSVDYSLTKELNGMQELFKPRTNMDILCEYYGISGYCMNNVASYLDKWIDNAYYYIIDEHFEQLWIPIPWWFKNYKQQYDKNTSPRDEWKSPNPRYAKKWRAKTNWKKVSRSNRGRSKVLDSTVWGEKESIS